MKKWILSGFMLLLVGIGIFFNQSIRFSDRKLHIIFCDVGQGDGIVIRTPTGKNILVDGGPDEKILSCLSDNTPFWERTIHAIILSHPHADHLLGLIPVIERYITLSFYTERLSNSTPEFQELLEVLKEKKISPLYAYAGDSIKTSDGVRLTIVSPTKEFLRKSSPTGTIGESKEFGSLAIHVSYGQFDVLFTGDGQVTQIKEGIKTYGIGRIEVFQVPHHGSKSGVDQELLDVINPHIAVISVGKNSYGHPSAQILQLLQKKGVLMKRTDREGDIEIVTDGNRFYVK